MKKIGVFLLTAVLVMLLPVQLLADGLGGMVWVYINDPGVSGHEGFNGYMSKYETTNAQYCQYLNSAKGAGLITVYNNDVYAVSDTSHSQIYLELYPGSSSYSQITYSGGTFSVRSRDGYGMSNHPVVEVSWYGAMAFCNYYDFRLPTEWEWQAVADYDGSYTYGCGTTINQSKANYYDNGFANPLGLSSYPYTSPVGYYPAYGYGMNDMAGNVWEWTSSCYYSRCDYGYRVIRGGSWTTNDIDCTVSYRPGPGTYPSRTYYTIGFRVVLDSAPLPDLIVNSLTVDTNPIMQPRGADISCTIRNQGDADAANFRLRVMLSTDDIYDDPGDKYIAGRQITINLGPGATKTEEFNFNSEDYSTGTFYLVAKVDAFEIIPESSENNNTKASQPLTIVPFTPRTVQGYVKDSGGNGIGGVQVNLTGDGENQTDITQSNGWYNFDSLADGTYTVTAVESGCWTTFTNNPQSAIISGANVWLLDMIGTCVPIETISQPGMPSGEPNAVEGMTYSYNSTGATSSEGHALEYQFDWDDGSFSLWSTSTSASHSWSSTGERQIRVTARCQTHTDKTNTSDPLPVTVIPDEPHPPAKLRLIIDTDPAVGDSDPDDGTAIIYAFQLPDLCTIEGITYGYGNFGHQIPDSDGTRGANRMLDYYLLQLNKMLEVLHEAGAIENDPNLRRGHKESETWDDNEAHPQTGASDFIRETVRDNPGQITVVALGTLTNIATAMANYPNGQPSDPNGFMQDCKELWIIGGSVGPLSGNVLDWDSNGISLKTAEWNIWRDRKAAEYVFKHAIKDNNGIPKIKMVPLNATMRWIINTNNITTLENSKTRIANYLGFPLRWWLNEANPLDCRQVADPYNWRDWLENAFVAIAKGSNLVGGIPDLSGLNLLDLNWIGDPIGSFQSVLDYMADILPVGPAFPPYDTIGMVLALEPNDPNLVIETNDYKVFVDIPTGATIRYDDLEDREEVRVFLDFDSNNMTNKIVTRWSEKLFHQPPENKEFVECDKADYFVLYHDPYHGDLFFGPYDVNYLTHPYTTVEDDYRHLPVGVAPFYPYEGDGKYRGRLIFDVNLPDDASVTEVKLHIYCDKKKDWFDTGHRASIYYCDPQENDAVEFWNSATEPNQYVDSTHIGTLQVWRTVNLGAKGVGDLQNVVSSGQFAILLAEDGDDHPCAWFDTSEDWKAYLEIDYDITNIIDFDDLARLLNYWLLSCSGPEWCEGYDYDESGKVNFIDFAFLADHWLEGAGQ